jgi:hypothetical protein
VIIGALSKEYHDPMKFKNNMSHGVTVLEAKQKV